VATTVCSPFDVVKTRIMNSKKGEYKVFVLLIYLLLILLFLVLVFFIFIFSLWFIGNGGLFPKNISEWRI